jgi:hypothetical protein
MKSEHHIRPDLSRADAMRLVKLIKHGSDYAGMLVMMSMAKTLRYVNYSKVSYSWKSRK